jgi:hypothetical protein
MRRRVPLVSLLLAVALLAGQLLVAVHDSDHGLQAGATHDCVVCVYAHGAGNGALPSTPQLAIVVATEAPEITVAASADAVAVRLHPIRGPPLLLA